MEEPEQLVPRTPIEPQLTLLNPMYTMRIIKILGAVLCVLLVGVLYFFRDPLLSLFPFTQKGEGEQKHAERVYDPTKQSTAEQLGQNISRLDEKIKNASSERERLGYLLQKGFALVVNRVEKPELEVKREARKHFTLVYDATSGKPEYQALHDIALWGYVFQFAENCFGPAISGSSEEIRNSYFAFFNEKENRAGPWEISQKKMFEGIFSLIDDPARFTTIRNDKIFNSYAAMIRAIYLDAYRDEMTPEEVAIVTEALQMDINHYENAQYIMERRPDSSMRTALLAPMHMAFARFALGQALNGEDFGIDELDMVYEQISQSSFPDAFGKSIVISWIKLYKLGALNRAPHTEDDVVREVAVIREQIAQNPQIVSVIQSTLNYAQSPRGKWIDIRQDVFKLAYTSPSLAGFLDEIGIKGY